MLDTIDLTRSLERDEYKRRLAECQVRMRELAHQLYTEQRSLVIVAEGWDAAGKGGALRRVTGRTDPRGYQVFAIAAPSGEDKTHHYLWRFWRRLTPPEDKQIMIFDRSWYGRVLVERVEGFATEDEWRRAYREINDFERQLTNYGMVVVKFWFHISKEEQLSRFEAREKTPHKTWKLTDEDWRNRDKWDQYEEAVEDMLLKTSTLRAPWSVVAGNDKYWARVRTQEILIESLEKTLGTSSRGKSKSGKKGKSKK